MTAPRPSMRELLQRTATRIRSGTELPKSPGRMEDNVPLLCAGAAVVQEAAHSVLSIQEAADLAREIVARGSEHIVTKARHLNLDTILVRAIVLKNDSLDDGERRDAMADFLLAEAAHAGS